MIIQCACGCEKKLKKLDDRGRSRKYIVGHNKNRKGIPVSLKTKRKISKTLKSYFKKFPYKHPWWKGGIKIHNGYIYIKKRDHPFCGKYGYVFKHRLIMESHLGRYLTPNEIVHHRNGDRRDNRIENLEIMNRSTHQTYHNLKRHSEIKGGDAI